MTTSRSFMKVLLLVAILAFATATEEALNELSEFDTTPWGKKILDVVQVQLSLAGGDRVAEVIKALEKMRENLLAEKNASVALSSTRKVECFKHLNLLTKQIDESSGKFLTLESVVMNLNWTAQETEQYIEFYDVFIEDIEWEIDQLQKQRNIELKLYDERMSELNKLVDALGKIRALLKQIGEKNSAFAEIPSVAGELEHLPLNYDELSAFRNMALMMIQSLKAGKWDKKTIASVDKVIVRITESIAELRERLARSEYNKKKIFKAMILNSEARLLEATAEKARFEDQVLATRQRLQQNTVDLTTARRIAKEKKQERQDKRTQCENQKTAASEARVARNNQLDVIQQIITLINTKTSSVKKYVAKRQASVSGL